MRKTIILLAVLSCQQAIFSQSVPELLKQVFRAQHELKTVSYSLMRKDTLVTGLVRSITGLTKTKMVAGDSLFGFWFCTKRDDAPIETIYDGKTGIEVNHDKKEYKMVSDKQSLLKLPYNYGQVIFTELLRLDTSKATGFDLTSDGQYYYLKMHLPDIPAYGVTNRYKKYSIDKKIMLPVRMKNHQETIGKVQDLYFEVKDIWINNEEHAYDFSGQRFPTDYRQLTNAAKPQPSTLLHRPAPPFSFVSTNGEKVSFEQTAGKTTLLSFGEVWCGPCLSSMPEIQKLHDKYKTKGFQVYEVSFEKEQLQAFQKMMEKLSIRLPLAMADTSMKTTYEVNGIPKYVLIDKTGQISFVSTGFSDTLEKEIAKCLEE